jgi:hypothetical protein
VRGRVADEGPPLLIDCARAEDGAASLDAVTLELGIVFHPAAEQLRAEWPTVGHAQVWDDLDRFVDGCPVAEFIRACRAWAIEVAEGRREVLAVTYSVATRHLKFPDVDHSVALAIAKRAVEAFDEV